MPRRPLRPALLLGLSAALLSPTLYRSSPRSSEAPRSQSLPGPASAAHLGAPATFPDTPLLATTAAPHAAVLPDEQPFYRRQRAIELSAQLLRTASSADPQSAVGQRWRFELFDDTAWTGIVTRVESVGPGRVNLYGELEGVPGSDFIASVHDTGAAALSFTTPGGDLYQIRMAGPGRFVALQLAPELMPPCGVDAPDTAHLAPAAAPAAQARARAAAHNAYAADIAAAPAPDGSAYGGLGQQAGSEEGLTFTDVDIYVAYTAAAQSGAGGSEAMSAFIDLMVARANATFINSRVGLRLRLVGSGAVAYTEPNNIQTDLSRLAGTNDGFMDGLHATRATLGADLVTLVTETTGGGTSGLAYLYTGTANNGLNVVQRAGSESTFVHEVGHNFGCKHDRENNDSGNGLYPYGYGHRFTPEGYPQLRTVMAYAPGARIPYFSNPDVTYLGAPTGVPIGQTGEAHNAQVLNTTKASVANFRTAGANTPPSVVITAPTADSVLVANDPLTLTATASDPDGSIASVRFYQLSDDSIWGYSNVTSTTLGSDITPPYAVSLDHLAAGYYTFAAVARDNTGAIATHTVGVTVNPWYKQELLSLPDGYTGDVTLAAINASGQIAGTVTNGVTEQACRWDGTAAIPLGFLPGDVSSHGLAIADDGTVYGESISSGGDRRACRWSPAGVVTDLSTAIPGKIALAALGVDQSGRVLYETEAQFGGYYRDSTPIATNLSAFGIASSGLVAGYDYNFGTTNWNAARWSSGPNSTLLPPLAGHLSSWGWSINRSGAVVGISSPTGGYSSTSWRATYWAADSTTPVDLAPAGSTASTATALNDHNEVVGHYRATNDRPFLWTSATGSIPLRDLVMPAVDFDLYYPRAIGNTGAIAIEGWNFANLVPVRLTPVAGFRHQHWQRSHFSLVEIESSGVAGDLDDPDNDGRVNLLERAFGLSPTVAETTIADTGHPVVGYDDSTQKLTITFRRLRGPTDITYTVEAASDLANGPWSSAGAVEVSRDAIDADWDEVVYRSVASPAPGAPVFLRVRISR